MLHAEEEEDYQRLLKLVFMLALHPGFAFKHVFHSALALTVYGGCKHSYAATAALEQPVPSA